MKNIFWGFFSVFAVCTLVSGAEALIKNGSFEDGAAGWVVKGKCSFDTDDKTDGQQSLRVTKKNGRGFDEIRQEVQVEPETDYELTYDVKCVAVEKASPQARAYGVSVSLAANGKRSCYGSGGLWKYDNGTFDWKKVVVRFNTKAFKNPEKLLIGIQCPAASGTFRVDAVSLRKIGESR